MDLLEQFGNASLQRATRKASLSQAACSRMVNGSSR